MHTDPDAHLHGGGMLADAYQHGNQAKLSPAGSYHHSMHADSDKK